MRKEEEVTEKKEVKGGRGQEAHKFERESVMYKVI